MTDLPPVAPGYETEYDLPEAEDVSGCLANCCVLNKETLTEALSLALRTPLFRVLRILEPCLAAIALGLLIWALVKQLGTAPVLFYGLLLAALLYFYLQQFVLYPKKAVKNQLIRQGTDYGTPELENWLYFKEENVANRRGEAEELLHMPYDKLRRIIVGERLIVLVTKSRNSIPLDRAGFENGSAEDLLRLLARKAPDAKLYHIK
ncbi:MAG: YcxB family protein [Oscillospiraceae bacterium]|nr:YcxB family protein [Oscillospiraceae bacterium]